MFVIHSLLVQWLVFRLPLLLNPRSHYKATGPLSHLIHLFPSLFLLSSAICITQLLRLTHFFLYWDIYIPVCIIAQNMYMYLISLSSQKIKII